MISAFTNLCPLTLTLSPEGRGDFGASAGARHDAPRHAAALTSSPPAMGLRPASGTSETPVATPLPSAERGAIGTDADGAAPDAALTSPLWGEVAAQRRVRGLRAQPAQIARARSLRSGMTDAESRLWYHLRNRRLDGFKIVRQLPIAGYYADFACREAMLVIEADGGQHDDAADKKRDTVLRGEGFAIPRFWNDEILADTPAVLETILKTLVSCVPWPPRREGQGEGRVPATVSKPYVRSR